MATASVPNVFVNSTPADATQVNANFASLVTFANNQVVHRDGSKAMTAAFDVGTNKIVNVGQGTNPNDAVNKAQLDAAGTIPVGAVVPYAAPTAPVGWLLCEGQAVSRSTYSVLFGLVGTTYGVGDNSTTFNLPDLRSRFPVGKGAAGWSDALNESGGSADAVVVEHSHTINHGHANTLAVSSAGVHAHEFPVRDTSSLGTGDARGTNSTGTLGSRATETAGAHVHSLSGAVTAHSGSSANSGEAAANKNLPPYITLNYIIRAI